MNRDNMVDNPMILNCWGPIKPRYHEVIDELNNERYIVDEYGREIDPALLCEDNPDVDLYEEQQIERFNGNGRIKE